MPRSWCIYRLQDPRTLEIRYIGFTSQSTQERLQRHINVAINRPRRNHRDNWILSLVAIGLRPVIAILQSGTGGGWQEAEQQWIRFYRSQGARLVNATAGGEGLLDWGTPEQRTERARKRAAGMTAEQRSAIARKSASAVPPEERSAIAKRRWATRTPEERSRITRPGGLKQTTEERKAAARKGRANRTTEAISAAAKLGWSRKTDEQREQFRLMSRQRSKKYWESLTPAQRISRSEELAKAARKRWSKGGKSNAA